MLENFFLDTHTHEKNHKINTRKKTINIFLDNENDGHAGFGFCFCFSPSADAFSEDDKDNGDEGVLCWWSCHPCLCVFLAFDCVVPYGFLCPASLSFLLPFFLSFALFSFFFLSSFGVFFLLSPFPLFFSPFFSLLPAEEVYIA
jgi:hypothetical protein